MKFYRNYKNFDKETFKAELLTVLSLSKGEHYSSFQETFISVLHHALTKKTRIR